MANEKVHKQEAPNKAEPTPQKKKAISMRKSGMSLAEISASLNIPRKKVEELLAKSKVSVEGPKERESQSDARREKLNTKGK